MSPLAQTWAFARLSVLRMVRDRGNIFFVFIFPLLLVLLIGAQFGGGSQDLRLGVVAGDTGRLGDQLVEDLALAEGVEVVRHDTAEAVTEAVASGDLIAGLVLPDGYGDALRAGGDQGVVVEFVGRADSLAPVLQSVVVPVVGEQNNRVTLADLVRVVAPTAFGDALSQADAALGVVPEIGVSRDELGSSEVDEAFAGLGRFDLGAVQQLLLFVFLSTLTSAVALIQSRDHGVTTRLLAYPTTTGRILRGEAAGRFAVGMAQGVYIVVGTLLMFGVDWGDPVSALVILGLFAAVSAGAAMVLGALASNEAQASAAGVGIGLVAAAVGGSMLPRELMPDAVQVVSRVTPHAWAYEAFAEVVRRDGTVLDVLPQLGVLAGMAALLLSVGGVLLRRTLTRAA